MRIGVVSDTHNHLPNVRRIVELFNEARVERVVHTGDITQAKTVEALAGLEAPVFGVYGNNDLERDPLAAAAQRVGMTLAEPPLELCFAGRNIVVVHDPQDLEAALGGHHQLALHGHNHEYVEERRAGCLVFNPGECAGHVAGWNAVGVVDLVRMEASRLRF